MKNLILIGGGGHCKSCIEVIEGTDLFKIIGILDVPEKIGNNILGYNIIGTDNEIKDYVRKGFSFFITIGQIKADNIIRSSLFEKLIYLNADLPVIHSSSSVVSKHSKIGVGSVVLSGAIINAEVSVGKNCIINSNALLEHDVKIGNFCHISTGAVINGDCSIGNNCMIGTGAILRNGIRIPDNTLIGMGAVVTKTIKTPGVYLGNPARKIK